MIFKAVFLLVGISLTMISGSGPIGSPDEVPAINHDLDLEWNDYMKTYGKSYKNSREQNDRRRIWQDELAIINRHNTEAALGKHTYTMGVNAFTDMTDEEFSLLYISPPRQTQTQVGDALRQVDTPVGDVLRQVDTPAGSHTHHINVRDIPAKKDWREDRAVTSVKDQGSGGTCWAFSAVGSIEGQRMLKYGKLESLSAQMLVDCCTAEGNKGCNGGLATKAFDCVVNKKGIVSEKSYPYTGKDGICKIDSSRFVANVTGYHSGHGQPYLTEVLYNIGPVSVSIRVTVKLKRYRNGVFSDRECNTGATNHAVLAVGYGDGYWLIKNSWGTGCGIKGYYKIKRTAEGDGECKIASRISYPYMAPVSLTETSNAFVPLRDFSHVLITSILVKILNAFLGRF